MLSTLKTVFEVASITGLAVSTLNKWRLAGTGPRFIKLGKSVRYRDEDIQDFIDASTRVSTSQSAAG